ncbi:MAG: site-specific DNA-methyltransferase [Candidatus Portnoybacteria bacterium]|nr:site-specific DNA-methyltransferase [Candidatus Portnoybacteria bacterium]
MKYPDDFINKIIQGDCLDVMKEIPDNSIDLVITSPPYDNLRDYKGYSFDFEGIANELYRIIKQGGVIVWVVGDATINGSETGTSFKQALYFKEIGFNLHDTMIWERATIPQSGHRYEPMFEYMFIISKGKPKTFNPIMVKKLFTETRKVKKSHRNKKGEFGLLKVPKTKMKIDGNIWKISQGGGISTKDKIAHEHPAIFPDKLAERHIKSWSNEGDLILDPMCGSGTTCKMAKLLKRNYIGIEISKDYCEIARKRLGQEILF